MFMYEYDLPMEQIWLACQPYGTWRSPLNIFLAAIFIDLLVATDKCMNQLFRLLVYVFGDILEEE